MDYTLVNNISGAVDLGTHFIMGEPRFVDAPNGDFHLRSDSPAVDVGDSSVIESYPFLKDDTEIDLDGNPRLVGGAIFCFDLSILKCNPCSYCFLFCPYPNKLQGLHLRMDKSKPFSHDANSQRLHNLFNVRPR
ncbi:MAG: hypothetical protein ABFS56_07590 [Pseudomonadota bacterium]